MKMKKQSINVNKKVKGKKKETQKTMGKSLKKEEPKTRKKANPDLECS
jgi:hypothetical protein